MYFVFPIEKFEIDNFGGASLNNVCCWFMYTSRVVEYANYDDMKNAMKKLDGSELNGRKLRLVEDYRGRRRR